MGIIHIMVTKARKIGRINRYGRGVVVNKTVTVLSTTDARMTYARSLYGVNWSAECERMILEYIDQLEKGA